MPQLDLLWAACTDGGVRRRLGQVSVMARPLLGLAARGEKEEERGQHVAEGVLMPPRGPGERGGGRGGQGDTAANGGSVSPVATGERDDRWGPLSDSSPFSILQKFQ